MPIPVAPVYNLRKQDALPAQFVESEENIVHDTVELHHHWRVFVIGLEATTLQFLIEHTPAAVAIFDSDMCYLAASRRYVANYHLAGNALTGRSHYEVFPEISDRWKEIHRR